MMSKSVLSLLDEAFGRGQKSRDGINYSVSCPSCDKQRSKKKLSIRLDDYRYHCWVCGLKGKNIWAYVEKNIPGFSHKLRGLNLTKRRNIFEKEEVEEQEQLDLPPGLSPVLRASKDPDKVSVKKYLTKKRGLSSKDIFRWRVLSCKTGKYRRHAVIPSFDKEGKLNYFVARAVDDTTIKYRNARVSKIDVIFNEIDIDWKKRVILVEGVFDAIKCPENTVPILGSSLSKQSKLYREIVKNQTDVIVALDPDLPGKAYKIAKDISEGGNNVWVCFAPLGKDLGDMTKESALQVIKSAKEYSPYMSISQKINSIQSGSVL